MANEDPDLAAAIARAIKAVDRDFIFVVMPGLACERAGEAAGLKLAREIYADRAYAENGNLVSRKLEGAVIHDADLAAERVLRMVESNEIVTVGGRRIPRSDRHGLRPRRHTGRRRHGAARPRPPGRCRRHHPADGGGIGWPLNSAPDVARMKRDLATLVGIDTQNPPGREIEAAKFLHGLLAAEGFDVSLSEYEPGRANVVARLENGGGKVFAFNTHMDVVPVGEGWSSDPFKLREAEGRLYGRGACDCKGPLAAMVEAMRMLAAERQSWSGTLLGVFVGDEEVGERRRKGLWRLAAAHRLRGGRRADLERDRDGA